MVIACGLKAKYCLFKTILDFEGVCLDEKPISSTLLSFSPKIDLEKIDSFKKKGMLAHSL
jgi:hypothetical protein